MMRSLTFIAFATSATAFQSSVPSSTSRTALDSTAPSLPFYAETISVTMDSALVNVAPVIDDVPAKSVLSKKAPREAAPGHKEGIFSPMVLFVKGVLGAETLNKVRGKAISLHSDVIGSFVQTSESAFGDAVLRSLFHVADKDGDGTICKNELGEALQSLGFIWLQDKQVTGIFKRADKDENKAIDVEEWIMEAPKTLRTNLVKLAKKNGGELGFLV